MAAMPLVTIGDVEVGRSLCHHSPPFICRVPRFVLDAEGAH